MPDVHALLSASSSHRWLACTKSAKLEAGYPDQTSSYAEEGTVAHALADIKTRYVLSQISKKEYNAEVKKLKDTPEGCKYINAEMEEATEAYAKFIHAHYQELRKTCKDPVAMTEVRVDFSNWVPEGFGTSDCLLIADDILEVIDFKYGKGVKVEAAGNSQMQLYALGACQVYGPLYDPSIVHMTIFQPRISSEPSTARILIEDLYEWAETTVRPKAALAFSGKGDFAPSVETCRFCKVKAVCRARYTENVKLFDDAPDPEMCTVDELAKILDQAKDIKAWLADIEEHIFATLSKGDSVPGWKLVEGRSVRDIRDKDEAIERFLADGVKQDDLYEYSLLSLAKMEKAFGKAYINELLGDLIVKPVGKLTLAPESDKRPAVTPEEALLKEFE